MPKDASGGCMEKWLSYMVFCLRPPSSLTIFITAVKSELFLENMVRVFVCDHLLSCVHLFVTPWTVGHQAPLSMGFPRQEYWSGLPCPSPEDLPNQGSHCRQILYHCIVFKSEHSAFLLFRPGRHRRAAGSKPDLS